MAEDVLEVELASGCVRASLASAERVVAGQRYLLVLRVTGGEAQLRRHCQLELGVGRENNRWGQFAEAELSKVSVLNVGLSHEVVHNITGRENGRLQSGETELRDYRFV